MPQWMQDSIQMAAVRPKSLTKLPIAFSTRSASGMSPCLSKRTFGRGAHSEAPLRSNSIPCDPRAAKIVKACISLPNGNQIISAATDRMCTASSVS